MSKRQLLGLFVLIGLGLGLGMSLLAPTRSAPQGIEWLENTRDLPLIKLIGRQGDVTESDFEGRLSLVLFGFTHCPDVCPTGLAKLASLGGLLTQDTLDPNVQFVFVSVDPERDDVTRLADYLAVFSADIIGLTGQVEDLNSLTEALGSFYQVSGQEDDYQVSHSVAISVIGPDKRLIGRLRPGYDIAYVSRQLIEYKKSASDNFAIRTH